MDDDYMCKGECEQCRRRDVPLFMCDVDDCESMKLVCEGCGLMHLREHERAAKRAHYESERGQGRKSREVNERSVKRGQEATERDPRAG